MNKFVNIVTNFTTFEEELGGIVHILQEHVRDSAFGILDTIRAGMRDEVKLGRVYSRPGGFHVSSAPGQFPAIDSGKLFRSLEVDYRESDEGATADIGTDVDYAVYLQRGTHSMSPRPIVRDSMGDDFTTGIAAIIDRVIK